MRQILRYHIKFLLLSSICFISYHCNHQPDYCDTNNYTINYDISGRLIESFTYKPLKDQLIRVIGSGPYSTIEITQIITDDSGYFSVSGTAQCPSPAPEYLQVDGNEWRCAVQFNYSTLHDSLFEIPPMAYIKLNLHRIDSNVAFDSLVISAGCCCQFPGVKILSHFVNATDTTFIKPIGGDQKETIEWIKYENSSVVGHDTLQVNIPGIDTVEATINF